MNQEQLEYSILEANGTKVPKAVRNGESTAADGLKTLSDLMSNADLMKMVDGIFDFITSVGLAEETDFLADITVDSIKLVSSNQAQAYVEVKLGKREYKDLMNLIKEKGTWHILSEGK